jgi:hypothetical protein
MERQELVRRRKRSGESIRSELTAKDCDLLHDILDCSGEIAGLLDVIKKTVMYRQPIDRKTVIEKFGDIEFYMEVLRQTFGVTRDECIKCNIEKLSKSCAKEPPNKAAQSRKDKTVGVVVDVGVTLEMLLDGSYFSRVHKEHLTDGGGFKPGGGKKAP